MNDIVREYKEIREDYAYKEDMFTEEPDKVRRLKKVISELDQVDRTLILLYADCQSFRKLGKRLGLSHQSAKKVIDDINEKILARYYEIVAQEIYDKGRNH